MQEPASPTLDNKGIALARNLLKILITYSMLMSAGNIVYLYVTVGSKGNWVSIGGFVFESLIWIWLWNGSNAARIISFLLYVFRLLLSVYITVVIGIGGIRSSTPETIASDCRYTAIGVGFTVFTVFGTYILQTPGTREFLRLQREKRRA